jgi:hypothetical protein
MGFSIYDEEYSLLLPACFKPAPGELFSSWLTRLAYNHFQRSYNFTKLLLKDTQVGNRDIDCSASDELLRKVTVHTNTTFEELKQTLLTSYEGKLFSQPGHNGFFKWLWPMGAFCHTRNRYGLTFCPQCLQNDCSAPYFRKQWRIALYTVCPRCGHYLQEGCPQCKSPVIFYRSELTRSFRDTPSRVSTCYKCNFDLAECPVKPAPASFHHVQRHYHRVLEESLSEKPLYPHLYFDVIYQLIFNIRKPGQLVRNKLSEEIPIDFNFYQGHRSTNRFTNRFTYFPIEEKAKVLYAAWWLLEEYPERFVGFFKDLKLDGYVLFKNMADMAALPFIDKKGKDQAQERSKIIYAGDRST